MRTKFIVLVSACLIVAPALAKPIILESTPQTVYKGSISPNIPPVLHVKSGDTVVVNTVSAHSGKDPVGFFAKAGIPAKDVLQQEIDIANMPAKDHSFGLTGGKTLTGPIYIDGAEPGDILEVRILKVTPRVPYGENDAGNGGAAPGMMPNVKREPKIIKYDIAKKIVNFAPDIHYPTRPFIGTMAIASTKAASAHEPGQYGGNMDFEKLQAGSTLYLPVLVKGALFVAGDSHASQGDGEVSGNALEASMTPTLQFIVHKGEGKGMDYPYAEDAQNYYILGMDHDLGKALASSIQETVKFLGKHYGMSPRDAYSLCSTIIDFRVAEAVDVNLAMYGTVPKAYFKKKYSYWKSA